MPPLARLLLLLALLPSAAQAAGGHHAVDDAAVQAPGDCELEVWLGHGSGSRSLGHVGSACGWRGVELGLAAERARERGDAPVWLVAPQVKWATDASRTLSVGVVATLARQSREPRNGFALLVPLTWRPNDAIAVHANLGRDWPRGEPATTRRGIAVEWTPSARWLAVAEWFHDGSEAASRVGARWVVSPGSSFDLSVARSGFWTVGWNRAFGERE